jgi:hypothetical protein
MEAAVLPAVRCSCSLQAAQTVCCMHGKASATLNPESAATHDAGLLAQHAVVAEPQRCALPYMQLLHNTCTQQ